MVVILAIVGVVVAAFLVVGVVVVTVLALGVGVVGVVTDIHWCRRGWPLAKPQLVVDVTADLPFLKAGAV